MESVPVVYRVFPDYTADPVWTQTAMVDLDGLAISTELRVALRQWAAEWDELMGLRISRFRVIDRVGHRRWRADGRELAHRLQTELGESADVRYEA